MKKINVLIIPAGSGMAIAAIKSLKYDKNINIVSADSDVLAPGLYLSHKGYVVPKFSDAKFFTSVEKIISKEKINVIIPALDTILLLFSESKNVFEKQKVKVLVSDSETIKITRDKWQTYNKLKDAVSLPKSFINKEDVDIDFPLFIKPRGGSGSFNAYKVESKEELNFYYNRIEDSIIQEYLEGKEYTIDCLADNNGKLVSVICRERIETKAGISTKGKIVSNKKLENMALGIAQIFKFNGPFFFQAKENKNKIPSLLEVNSRMSGTMSFSSSSGTNLHVLAVKMCMGEKIKKSKIKYGLYMSRYLEDIYITEGIIKKKIKKI